ncbi:hypothetical protein [Streptomyces sp. NPDC020298]|uniref:hypothetical protein n=1 Tax=unclassified Streptomyces TaxID=2593676 RepID=UPI0033D134ED
MTRTKKIFATAALVLGATAAITSPALAENHAGVAPQENHAGIVTTQENHAGVAPQENHAGIVTPAENHAG